MPRIRVHLRAAEPRCLAGGRSIPFAARYLVLKCLSVPPIVSPSSTFFLSSFLIQRRIRFNQNRRGTKAASINHSHARGSTSDFDLSHDRRRPRLLSKFYLSYVKYTNMRAWIVAGMKACISDEKQRFKLTSESCFINPINSIMLITSLLHFCRGRNCPDARVMVYGKLS